MLDLPSAQRSNSAAPPLRDGRLPLEDVIITSQLTRRTPRDRDLHAEHLAVTALMEEMASVAGGTASQRVLRRLVDTACTLCQGDAAGISMLEVDGDHEVFRWHAIAGRWAHFTGGTIPYERSVCGLVVQRNAPVLALQPQRHFGQPPGHDPISEMLVIPFHFEDRPVGTLWVASLDERAGRRFDAEDLRLLTSLARFASIGYRLTLTQDRVAQLRLESDLADSRLLQAISSELITENDEKGFRERILDAALSIMHSDYASLQMFKDDGKGGGHLELIANRGFTPEAMERWHKVDVSTRTCCGEVLRTKRRVIVSDVTKCEFMAGSEELTFLLSNGVRAVQSTPLLSRAGRLMGAFTTHWLEVHAPSERDLRLLDILARQASDLLERMLAEERLRESDRRKEEFLATLAHELRNPLAPILNAVQCLELGGAVNPEMQWAHDVIVRQTTHLTRLVDDLLDVSRINHGRLEIRREPVDLARMLRTAVETTHPFVEQRRQTLVLALPPERLTVDADPVRLSQVFANLINNAAKFSREGERIEVIVEARGNEVLVRVRDDGMGIEAGELPTIFDLFRRVRPSYVHDQGGLGIGLTLVKRLVEMHGGDVTASSAGLGFGSEFTVRLSLVTRQAHALSAADDTLGAPHDKLRVLVVDDHADGATSMCRLLRVLGYDARQACDGLAGLDAAADFRPDVALLDIAMPRLSGYEVARRLREESWGKQMLLIAVTGWGQENDKQRATDAGFDFHLTKPVAVADLTRALSSIATTA
ncbi:MAG: GAF domain-containing protein [Gemmatimonadetes bacterium]|nr:GAF domain-containing protein [Gemmatimonadota bacterium]